MVQYIINKAVSDASPWQSVAHTTRYISSFMIRILPVLASFWALISVAPGQSVDNYISAQRQIARTNLLANIGGGSKAGSAKPGIVVASPSTSDPNYFFYWLRDGSLVYKYLIDEYVDGRDNSLRNGIDEFVIANRILQGVDNPSGSAPSGLNLGEPKYNVDETAFTGAWGRPQRDRPALRMTALITYANFLLSSGNSSFVKSTLWPVILKDADYVAEYWNQTSFDLWEEVQSSSFFTAAVQHRSLREVSALATRIGQTINVPRWNKEGDNILCFLQSFWSTKTGSITANTGGGRSGIDANSILASIHTFDPSAGCDPITFQPCSDVALSNLKIYVDSFRNIYSINKDIAQNRGIATGRYKEDVYMGGNPWYLTTLAVAEQIYDALAVWNEQGHLNVTNISLSFFRQFSTALVPGTYISGSETYKTLTTSVKSFADSFVSIVAKYTPASGALAEQFSRSNGSPLSAVDLTWSYASVLTALNARAGRLSNGWGAKGLTLSSTCNTSSKNTVKVIFNVRAMTIYGENIFLTGSIPELKSWNADSAIPLSAGSYPIWSVSLTLPADTSIQYKYIRREKDGSVIWESDPNMILTTPSKGNFTQNDTWR